VNYIYSIDSSKPWRCE